jgi:hypothetical protein
VQPSSIGMPQRESRQVLLAEPRDKNRVSLVLLLSMIICVRKSSPHRLD